MGIKSWIAGSALVTGLSRGPLSTELFCGVEKPTVTLAKMLAAEMLTNLDAHCRNVDYHHHGISEYEYSFPSFTLRSLERRDSWGDPKRYPLEYKVHRVTLSDGSTPFNKEELKYFESALQGFADLRKAHAANKAEHDRQQAAVDFIAKRLKVNEEDKTDATVDAVS